MELWVSYVGSNFMLSWMWFMYVLMMRTSSTHLYINVIFSKHCAMYHSLVQQEADCWLSFVWRKYSDRYWVWLAAWTEGVVIIIRISNQTGCTEVIKNPNNKRHGHILWSDVRHLVSYNDPHCSVLFRVFRLMWLFLNCKLLWYLDI